MRNDENSAVVNFIWANVPPEIRDDIVNDLERIGKTIQDADAYGIAESNDYGEVFNRVKHSHGALRYLVILFQKYPERVSWEHMSAFFGVHSLMIGACDELERIRAVRRFRDSEPPYVLRLLSHVLPYRVTSEIVIPSYADHRQELAADPALSGLRKMAIGIGTGCGILCGVVMSLPGEFTEILRAALKLKRRLLRSHV